MVRDFNDVFWPRGTVCSTGRALLDDSPKASPPVMFVVRNEAVATAGRAEVTSYLSRTIVCDEFRETLRGWSRSEAREGGAQDTSNMATGVTVASLFIYGELRVGQEGAGL